MSGPVYDTRCQGLGNNLARVRTFYRLLALAGLLSSLVSCAERPPDFEDSLGNPYSFAGLENKWVVVNYWAVWCGPCIQEIAELNELHHERDDVVVFGVNFDGETGETLAKQVAKMRIRFPVFVGDPPERFRFDYPQGLPTTHVVGPDGKLAQTLLGQQSRKSLDAATGR